MWIFQAISLICSGDIVDLKILQCNWLKTFWPISQEQEFSQIWDLCRNTTNINFHYRSNSVLAHFPTFGKIKFLWKIRLSRTTSYGFLATCQELEKTNDTTPRKRPDWRKDGRSLFHRTLPATAGFQKSKYLVKRNIFFLQIKKNFFFFR